MNNSLHTPGPWKTGDADWRIIVGPMTRFRNGRLSGVATIEESDNLPEDIFNARLIAAAPDLLSALERAVSIIEELPYPENYAAVNFLEIIRKAKGEA